MFLFQNHMREHQFAFEAMIYSPVFVLQYWKSELVLSLDEI